MHAQPKKKKGDDDDDFTANSHDDFMATVQASREAQDAAAKRLEEAYYTQIVRGLILTCSRSALDGDSCVDIHDL